MGRYTLLVQKKLTVRWVNRMIKEIQTIQNDLIGRDGEIRTHDPMHPMHVRYQAALRPDFKPSSISLKYLLAAF